MEQLENYERMFVGIISILAGLVLVLLTLEGPFLFDNLKYKTSDSAEYQVIGQDLVNLFLLAPLLIIGGSLALLGKEVYKHLLILTPIYMIYFALSYGIGMEWSDDRYSGNSEQYFYAYLFVIIVGLILLMYTISKFSKEDSPEFSKRQLYIYITLVGIFLLLFAMLWIGEVNEVIQNGDTASGSYSSAPTVFWVIRYFDLGFSIPLGFISLYLLATRTKTAYPFLLLFFGFFVTMIIAVNAMGAVMWYKDDPELQTGDLFVFWTLGILAIVGYLFLVWDKIRS